MSPEKFCVFQKSFIYRRIRLLVFHKAGKYFRRNVSFNQVAGWWLITLSKKRLVDICCTVSFAKSLRTLKGEPLMAASAFVKKVEQLRKDETG